MFHINPVNKPHTLDTYNFVLTQFTSIKSNCSFTNFTQIPGQDLVSICNITFDCLDKLSQVSEFIEKKINDQNLNEITLKQLIKLDNLNVQLHEQIYEFNNITHDITLLVKDSANGNLNQEVISYINFNIVNKYKQIILKIFMIIKKINVYVELLKPKLS